MTFALVFVAAYYSCMSAQGLLAGSTAILGAEISDWWGSYVGRGGFYGACEVVVALIGGFVVAGGAVAVEVAVGFLLNGVLEQLFEVERGVRCGNMRHFPQSKGLAGSHLEMSGWFRNTTEEEWSYQASHGLGFHLPI